jgi:hypothetical protein
MRHRKLRIDEVAEIIGNEAMGLEEIIEKLKELHPTQATKRLRYNTREMLTNHPERFDQVRPDTFQVRRTNVSYGKWESKAAFIRAHQHRTPQETIALAATYGMNLSLTMVQAIRNMAQQTREENEANLTSQTTALVSTRRERDGIDAMVDELLDQEFAAKRLPDQIALIVRDRVDTRAKEKLEAIIEQAAQEEIKAFFANL